MDTHKQSGRENFGLYPYFCFKHQEAEIEIVEDMTLQKCKLCGMKESNMEKHAGSYMYRRLQERQRFEVKQGFQAEGGG